jgi:ABC-2 type transport system permease protein
MNGVTRVSAHAGWELRLLLRNGEQILLMFVIPIALLIALDIMRGGEIDEQVPTVLTVSIIATCFTSLAIGTGFERRAGALKFLATTPLSRLDLLLGKALATGALAALSLAVLAIVAAVMGWRPGIDWLALAAFVILGGGSFAALAVLLAGALRAEAVLALANGIFVLLIVFGGVVFAAADMAPAIGAVVGLLPSAALADGLNAALTGGALPAGALLVLLAWGAAGALLARRTFTWD